LTNPRDLAAWLGGVDDYDAREWGDEPEVGRAWRSPAIAPDGTRGTVRGELLLVNAPRRLVTTWHASWEHDARSVVRFELEDAMVDGARGTRLTVIHTAPDLAPQHVSQFGAVRQNGWTALLARLAHAMSERLVV
ncbi:MAG: SRPBCC family protein, partial [Gemmatimonadales bacterium]